MWGLPPIAANFAGGTNFAAGGTCTGAFGFANATAPCWTGSSDALDGTLCAPILAGQDQYAFWDHGHPSACSHAIIAALVAIRLNPVPAATR